MNRIDLIYYKNKEIVRADFQGLTEDDHLIAFMHEIDAYLKKLDRPMLRLTLIHGVYFTPKVMTHLPWVTKDLQNSTIKDAVVGVTGIKRILLQSYDAIIPGRVKAFDSEEEAKEWLVL